MATKKTTAPKKTDDMIEDAVEETVEYSEPEELNLDTKVSVINIAPWPVYFAGILDNKSYKIPANGKIRMSRGEIIAQANESNRLFTGLDSFGSHATLYIDDAPCRNELGYQDGITFSDKKMQDLFSIKDDKKFQEKFKKEITLRAEMCAAVDAVKRLNLNDYRKIKFIESYTGLKVE